VVDASDDGRAVAQPSRDRTVGTVALIAPSRRPGNGDATVQVENPICTEAIAVAGFLAGSYGKHDR
jgi:hypothetical protein